MAASTSKPDTLAAALAAFQEALPRVEKDNVGVIPGKDGKQGYRYDYADLADISAIALPMLGRFGLSWSTKPTVNEAGSFVLEYRLRHASGEEDIGAYPLPDPTRTPPQQVGSHITYARRYALCSVTGIAPGGEDDDGAAAQCGHTSRGNGGQTGGGSNGHTNGHTANRSQPSEPARDVAEAVAEATRRLLSADTEKKVEWVVGKVAEHGDGELDATSHVPADDREAMGIGEGEKLTLDDLCAYVGGYWAKHGHGPRQDSDQALAAVGANA
ncbi:ERF family protein [Actinomycetospora aeridis]|uniref:ERF family protein n=1 Tax=Actinomycetospora aeridis TaxID=3129231 RepID=A0ABU8N150_9PSEU